LRKINLVIVLFLFLIQFSFGSNDRAGYEFLRGDAGARPSGLGGAFVSFIGDINAIYFNPAGIALTEGKNFAFSYINHIMDFNVGTVSYSQPLYSKGVLGMSVHFFDYGEFTGRDEYGNKTKDFGAADISFTAAYSYPVYENLYIGTGIKFFHSAIEDYSSSGFAVDVGAIYQIEKQDINIGLSIRNIGGIINKYIETKEKLPLELKGGLSKKLAHLPLILTVETRKYLTEDPIIVGGGEFILTEKIKLRFGYNSLGEDQRFGTGMDRMAGFSFGFGFILREFNVDYSFSSHGGLGSQNRFSITGHF